MQEIFDKKKQLKYLCDKELVIFDHIVNKYLFS